MDSAGIEKSFAESLEKEADVEVYTKLPRGFYINTPDITIQIGLLSSVRALSIMCIL